MPNFILYLQIFKYVDGILGVLGIRKETGYVFLESDLGGKKGHKEDAYAEGQVKQDFMPFKIVI